MAKINNKFVFFKTKAAFDAQKENLEKTSIVFVKDTPIIWTQGVTYDVSAGVSSMAIWTRFLAGIDANNPAPSLADIKSRLEALEGINHDAYIAADSALKTSLEQYADQAEADAVATAKSYTDQEIRSITTGAGYATTKYVDETVAGHASAVNTKFEDYSTTAQMNDQIDADVLVETNRALNAEAALGSRIDGVSAVAEAATTVDEVNAQIDSKISALKLGETYEAIGAEGRAKAYTDAEVAKKQDLIGDLETIRGNATAAMTWITSVTEEEDVDSAINKWGEIVEFLSGIEEPETLDSLLNDLSGKISTAQTAANNAQTHSEGVASDLSEFKTTVFNTYAAKDTETVASDAATRAEEAYTLAGQKVDAAGAKAQAVIAIGEIAEVSVSDSDHSYVKATVTTKGGSVTAVVVDDSGVKSYADSAKNDAIATAEAMWAWYYPEGE